MGASIMKTPTEKPGFVRDENGFIMPTVENFYKYCGERKLMGVKCKGCGEILWPPPAYARNVSLTKLSGRNSRVRESF